MDIFFVIVTALIAWHGLTFRDADGKKDFVRLLFGAIALQICLRVLFYDIFGGVQLHLIIRLFPINFLIP